MNKTGGKGDSKSHGRQGRPWLQISTVTESMTCLWCTEIHESVHAESIPDATISNDIEPQLQHIIMGCDDESDYSDDEEYSSEAGVFRAMCREGLLEE